MSDLFGAREQLDRLIAELKEGGEKRPAGEPTRGWHLPLFVNGYAFELGHHWRQFVERLGETGSATVDHRDPATCHELELARAQRFGLLFESLQEKYESASRTQSLLAKFANGACGFVLLLREFGLRTHYLDAGSVGFQGGRTLGNEDSPREYARAISPMPLLWVANPSESGALRKYVLAVDQDDPSYRLELQDDWERDVGKLIRAATFILVANDAMTPGVTREIELLAQLGRLGDAFFTSPENARQILGERSLELRAIDDRALKEIRSRRERKRGPSVDLPPPTSLWLSHEWRERTEREVLITYQLLSDLERPSDGDEPIHFSLFLDAYAFLLANLTVLELGAPLIDILDRVAYLFSTLSKAQLADTSDLARFYSSYADMLDEGSQSAPETVPIVDWNLYTFAYSGRNPGAPPTAASAPVENTNPRIDSESSGRRLKRILKELDQIEDIEKKTALVERGVAEPLTPEHQSILFGLLGAGACEKAMRWRDDSLELLEQSIEYYHRAVDLNPRNFMNLWNRGFAFEILGRHRLALRDYSATIRQNPGFFKAYVYRARILEQIGKVREALADLETAQSLEPADPEVVDALGRLEGREREAER